MKKIKMGELEEIDKGRLKAFEIYYEVEKVEENDEGKKLFEKLNEEGDELSKTMVEFITFSELDSRQKEVFEKLNQYLKDEEEREKEKGHEEFEERRRKIVSYVQITLAKMYEENIGVDQNYEKSLQLFRLSAQSGNAVAYNEIGWKYMYGVGVELNYAEAFKYYKLGEKLDNPSTITFAAIF